LPIHEVVFLKQKRKPNRTEKVIVNIFTQICFFFWMKVISAISEVWYLLLNNIKAVNNVDVDLVIVCFIVNQNVQRISVGKNGATEASDFYCIEIK
jgi:hypothetical protein